MEALLHSSQPALAEPQLREIGRGLGKEFDHVHVARQLADNSVQSFQSRLSQLATTAYLPELPATHRIAACNALCGFVDQCASSKHQSLNELVCNQTVSSALLTVYIRRFETGKAKSMKQVLDTILRTVSRQPAEVKAGCISDTVATLLEIVYTSADIVAARPCFHALTSMLNKCLINPNKLVEFLPQPRSGASESSDEGSQNRFSSLLRTIFEWVPQADVAPVVAQFISALLKSIGDDSSDSSVSAAAVHLPLLDAVTAHFDDFQPFTVHIFPAIFKMGIGQYWNFLENLGVTEFFSRSDVPITSKDSQTMRNVILCHAIRTGKELGLVHICEPSDTQSVVKEDSIIKISDRVINQLLLLGDPDMRLCGMGILIASHQTTKPLTKGALEGIKQALPVCFAEPDAFFRGEIFSLVQNLLDRIKAITAALDRAVSQATRKNDEVLLKSLQGTFSQHQDFVTWLRTFTLDELMPGASYQRHISALKISMILIRSGIDPSISESQLSKSARGELKWCFHATIMTPKLLRALLDCLMDPFDDVRRASAVAIKLCHNTPTAQDDGVFTMLEKTTESAKQMMFQSGRIDHADGYARYMDLLFFFATQADFLNTGDSDDTASRSIKILTENINDIQVGVDLAEKNLTKAVDSHPLHGQLTSLRYILETLVLSPSSLELFHTRETKFLAKVTKLLYQIWDCVQSVLCNDAPEGHLPDDIDEEATLDTKDVLSYAWRALKESSLLLRTVIANVQALNNDFPEKVLSYMTSLGELCFTQLADLRHRGAFSTVAQTFAVICVECLRSSDVQIKCLPDYWYQCTLDLIQIRGGKITRRSAGIPAMMIGLLAAGEDFGRAVKDLKAIASLPPAEGENSFDLPQVHALNCLKATFVSSKLVVQSEAHMVEVMGLAAVSLSSKLWPIRNCGLMLFRGLIDRLLGSHESFDEALAATAGSKLAYDRFPGLLDLLKRLLKEYASNKYLPQQSTAESVFPVLDLFRRAPPPPSARASIEPLILETLDSPQWHIREIAARTYAAMSSMDPTAHATSLLDLSAFSENDIHGRLLAAKHVVTIYAVSSSNLVVSLLPFLSTLAENLLEYKLSPVAFTALLDVTNAIQSQSAHFSKHQRSAATAHLTRINAAAASYFADAQPTQPAYWNLERSFGQSRIAAAITKSSDSQADTDPAESLSQVLTNLSDQTLQDISYNVFNNQIVLSREGQENLLTALEQQFSDPSTHASEVREATVQLLWMHIYNELRATRNLDPNIFAALDPVAALSTLSPPNVTQTRLAFTGYVLDIQFSAASWSDALIRNFRTWIQYIHLALHESNEFPQRIAAARSLAVLDRTLINLNSAPEDIQINIVLALYTALNDDDDEIRNLVATPSTKLIACNTKTKLMGVLAPGIASRSLISLLGRHYSSSSFIAREIVLRLTGSDAPSAAEAERAFCAVLQEDTSLFAVEKQNLYIDSAREWGMWAGLLKKMREEAFSASSSAASPSPAPLNTASRSASTASLLQALTNYTITSLSLLISHAKISNDGPLGWTTRGEIYAHGLRIIVCADAILDLRRTFSSSSNKQTALEREKISAEQVKLVRAALFELVQLNPAQFTPAQSSPAHQDQHSERINPKWKDQIEAVLARDIRAGTTKAGGLISGLYASLVGL